MKTRKIVSLILTLALLCLIVPTTAVSTAAAYSAIEISLSPTPCSANLSAASLPDSGSPTQGDRYYLNLACTTDYKLSKAEFYVKVPGASDYTLVYTYQPNGYFRWVYCAYTFASAGSYDFCVKVTTTDGARGVGYIGATAAAKQTTQTQSERQKVSGIRMNVSATPCSANLSVASLPDSCSPTQGDRYYLNLACTTDCKLSKAEFYVKAPG